MTSFLPRVIRLQRCNHDLSHVGVSSHQHVRGLFVSSSCVATLTTSVRSVDTSDRIVFAMIVGIVQALVAHTASCCGMRPFCFCSTGFLLISCSMKVSKRQVFPSVPGILAVDGSLCVSTVRSRVLPYNAAAMCTAVEDANSCAVTLGHEGTGVGTDVVAVFFDHSDHSELSAASCILHCSVSAKEGEEKEGGLKCGGGSAGG